MDQFGPFGRNIEPSARIRRAVRRAGFQTPIIVTGGVHGFNFAEKILKDGKGWITLMTLPWMAPQARSKG